MRYLVPLEERADSKSKVSWHFGRAPYYAVINANASIEYEILPSPGHNRAQCGALDIVRMFDVDAVITRAIGSRAYQALRSAGVLVFETKAERLEGVMEEIKAGDLRPYRSAAVPAYPGIPYGPHGLQWRPLPYSLGPRVMARSRQQPSGRIRVAVACEGGGGLNDVVSLRFGRCPTFTFVDVDGGEIVSVEVRSNPNATAPHGAGIAVAQFVANNGASYAVAGRFGPNAMQALSHLGITAVTVPPGIRVRDIVKYL